MLKAVHLKTVSKTVDAIVVLHDKDRQDIDNIDGVVYYSASVNKYLFTFYGIPLSFEQNNTKDMLAKLQKNVGGTIDAVYPVQSIRDAGWNIMYVNDNGLVLDLPHNSNATKMVEIDSLRGRCVLCRDAS